MRTELTLKWQLGDFPRDPVNKTWCIHCREHALISDWGTKILHAAQQGQKRKKKKNNKKRKWQLGFCVLLSFSWLNYLKKILNVGKYIPLYYLQKRIFIIFKDIFDYSIMCNINKFHLSILSQILLSIIVV